MIGLSSTVFFPMTTSSSFDWSRVANAPIPSLAPVAVKIEVPDNETPAARKKRLVAALVTAARGGDEAMVSTLLAEGADVDGRFEKSTALRQAFFWNHAAIARLLTENGATFDAATHGGREESLTGMAIRHHSTDLMGLLVEGKHDVWDDYPAMGKMVHNPVLLQWWVDNNPDPGLSSITWLSDAIRTLFNNDYGHGGYQWKTPDLLPRVAYWLKAALVNLDNPKLAGALRTYILHHEPGIDHTAPWNSLVTRAMGHHLVHDDALRFQGLLQAGFSPAPSIDEEYNTALPIGWFALRANAAKVLHLLVAEPRLVEEMRVFAANTNHLEDFQWMELNPDLLNLLAGQGLDIFGGLFPKTGKTLLHAVNPNRITRKILEWADRNQPDWLWQTDPQGQTVFNRLGSNGKKWEAEMGSARLRRLTPKASRKQVDVEARPVRKRL
jgi:hypothetical protein